MTAPVGPTGLAQRCSGKHDDEKPPSSSRAGLSGGAVRTVLLVGGERVGLEQLAVTAGFEHRIDERRTLSVSTGALLGGTLFTPSAQYHLSSGATASVGYSQLLVEPKGARPFVQVSGSLALSAATTVLGSYWAADIRGAVSAGWVLFDRFTPYAAARLFGGPVFWRGTTGTDQFHFQLGAGFVVGLPGGVDFTAECVPVGEQALSAGIGVSF